MSLTAEERAYMSEMGRALSLLLPHQHRVQSPITDLMEFLKEGLAEVEEENDEAPVDPNNVTALDIVLQVLRDGGNKTDWARWTAASIVASLDKRFQLVPRT